MFKRFAVQLMELNNYLPLLPGSRNAKKMAPEYLNNILLHAITNGWEKQLYLHGWYFKWKTYKDTCNIFERMEISEQV